MNNDIKDNQLSILIEKIKTLDNSFVASEITLRGLVSFLLFIDQLHLHGINEFVYKKSSRGWKKYYLSKTNPVNKKNLSKLKSFYGHTGSTKSLFFVDMEHHLSSYTESLLDCFIDVKLETIKFTSDIAKIILDKHIDITYNTINRSDFYVGVDIEKLKSSSYLYVSSTDCLLQMSTVESFRYQGMGARNEMNFINENSNDTVVVSLLKQVNVEKYKNFVELLELGDNIESYKNEMMKENELSFLCKSRPGSLFLYKSLTLSKDEFENFSNLTRTDDKLAIIFFNKYYNKNKILQE